MNTLGIFARYPEPGKTKTRLAAAIGNAAAAKLYAAFVRDLIERSSFLADSVCVAVTPRSEASESWFAPLLPQNVMLEFQPDEDFGQRIRWFFNSRAGQGDDCCLLIGSDSPDLPTSLITAAFAVLESHDLVLGPATDGGFVLVGMKGSAGKLFDDVRWSQSTTLLDMLIAAERLNRTTALLQPWYDVDTVENLGTLLALQRCSTAGNVQPARCPHTTSLLETLWPLID